MISWKSISGDNDLNKVVATSESIENNIYDRYALALELYCTTQDCQSEKWNSAKESFECIINDINNVPNVSNLKKIRYQCMKNLSQMCEKSGDIQGAYHHVLIALNSETKDITLINRICQLALKMEDFWTCRMMLLRGYDECVIEQDIDPLCILTKENIIKKYNKLYNEVKYPNKFNQSLVNYDEEYVITFDVIENGALNIRHFLCQIVRYYYHYIDRIHSNNEVSNSNYSIILELSKNVIFKQCVIVYSSNINENDSECNINTDTSEFSHSVDIHTANDGNIEVVNTGNGDIQSIVNDSDIMLLENCDSVSLENTENDNNTFQNNDIILTQATTTTTTRPTLRRQSSSQKTNRSDVSGMSTRIEDKLFDLISLIVSDNK
jgi:hypothetical protein